MRPRPDVVRGFEPPPAPWAPGHRGVDLGGRPGEAVLAAGAGVVTFSGVIAGVGSVTISHGAGWRTTYQPLTDRARYGSVVRVGQRIGALGTTGGHCLPRACLHWGALTGHTIYHDPLLLLGLGPPILLPLR